MPKHHYIIKSYLVILIGLTVLSCQPSGRGDSTEADHDPPAGMVYIPGGTFTMGARENEFARADEFPNNKVRVNGFFMDIHPVTNARFKAFVEATGYVTTAELPPDWEEMKKQLPPGTPEPPDSLLVPASLVFRSPSQRAG